MASLVVPFHGARGKSRLDALGPDARTRVSRAMLTDVVAACTQVGSTYVVGPVGGPLEGAMILDDPGSGQGAAVDLGLAVACEHRCSGPFLVVNADLPCATATDLRTLAASVPDGGVAVVAADDGTTNALGLSSAGRFRALYGPGSAARFGALEGAKFVAIANLVDDVDTLADLERLEGRLGARSAAALVGVRRLVAR
jgi:2-phospho-L-lactate guanylyltransferase